MQTKGLQGARAWARGVGLEWEEVVSQQNSDGVEKLSNLLKQFADSAELTSAQSLLVDLALANIKQSDAIGFAISRCQDLMSQRLSKSHEFSINEAEREMMKGLLAELKKLYEHYQELSAEFDALTPRITNEVLNRVDHDKTTAGSN